jgi:ATP-binding cassette subfamily B protein
MPPMQQMRERARDKNRVPKPTTLREVPGYVKEMALTLSFRVRYIFRLVWEAKPSLLLVMLLFSLFDGFMPVVGSLIGAAILNRLAAAAADPALGFSGVIAVLVLQFAYTFVRSSVSRIYDTTLTLAGEVVSNHIKRKIMAKAKEIDMVSYDSPEFYASMENANREASSRPIQVMSSSFGVLSYLISIVSYIAVIFSVNALASLLIILASVPIAYINFSFRRKNVEYLNRRSKNRRKMDYFSNVVVDKDLAKEMRVFKLSDYFGELYQESFDEYYAGLQKLKVRESVWSILASVVNTVVYCGLYIVFARDVYDGRYPVGNFVLYTGAITSIGDSISSLITSTSSIYENTLFINNLIEFLDMEPTIVPSIDAPAHVERHRPHTIEFRDVSFAYPGGDHLVLDHASFVIEPGETIALVGLNGAGKTTIVKLLMRLYDPVSGVVLLDGRDIREYDVDELYAMYGVIFQDFGKYAVSVRENIRMSRILDEADERGIERAAEQSGASAFIERFRNGYDTQLMRYFDLEGTELSGGQWQKLAVARAFYSDSDVLILDEPTASLDPRAEQEIFNRFTELRRQRTCILISHRLSSATMADRIMVLKDGAIAEMGTHAELMARGGEYAQLFELQASRYVQGVINAD